MCPPQFQVRSSHFINPTMYNVLFLDHGQYNSRGNDIAQRNNSVLASRTWQSKTTGWDDILRVRASEKSDSPRAQYVYVGLSSLMPYRPPIISGLASCHRRKYGAVQIRSRRNSRSLRSCLTDFVSSRMASAGADRYSIQMVILKRTVSSSLCCCAND